MMTLACEPSVRAVVGLAGGKGIVRQSGRTSLNAATLRVRSRDGRLFHRLWPGRRSDGSSAGSPLKA